MWRLLPKAFRARVSRQLELRELEALNDSFVTYRKGDRAHRQRVELAVLRATRSVHSSIPVLVSAVGGLLAVLLLAYHIVSIPNMGAATRLTVFVPLLLGVLSPLSLHLLGAVRSRELFRWQLSAESAAVVFACFMGLLWTLYFIGESGIGMGRRPTGLTLLALTLGAISAPLLEEVFFRELIPTMFGRHPHYLGHLVGSVLFALAHVPSDFVMLLEYVLAGLFLSVARSQSGGLLYPFMIHSAANATHQLLF